MKSQIYLVDDDEGPRLTYKINLISKGLDKSYDINEFIDGQEALNSYLKLEERGILRLVITDLIMPEMDGFELTKNLRKEKYENGIILVTSNARFGTGADKDKIIGLDCRDYDNNNIFISYDEIKKMGIDEIIAKPFSSANFLRAVEKCLQL